MDKIKLKKLYNTLLCIETKGENTRIMAECLIYLERLISEENKPATKNEASV